MRPLVEQGSLSRIFWTSSTRRFRRLLLTASFLEAYSREAVVASCMSPSEACRVSFDQDSCSVVFPHGRVLSPALATGLVFHSTNLNERVATSDFLDPLRLEKVETTDSLGLTTLKHQLWIRMKRKTGSLTLGDLEV